MFNAAQDSRVRLAALDWLASQVARQGDVLLHKLLAEGFILDGSRVPLVGPQGIWKPRVLQEAPLSITTSPESPYDDSFDHGLLRYRYRGTDPDHPDNRGLRTAMWRHLPLIYFHGIVPSKYLAAWPVFVVGDDPKGLAFSVAVDDASYSAVPAPAGEDAMRVGENADTGRRLYITAAVRLRLHQRAFRERVLDAYHRQCAFCRLRHEELLDAAHIVPDTEPRGEPVVRNGISLCKLHHAAFDQCFLGLRPDYVIEVRQDIRSEHDGPTLLHAIQALHGAKMALPTRSELRPDPSRVAIRYERFLEAGASAA